MANHHGMRQLGGLTKFHSRAYSSTPADRFGRLFPDLPALFSDPRILERLGAAGGPMDAGDQPQRTQTVPVGTVFLGQFIDHDITLDVESSFDTVNQPESIENSRTPTLDLDCVYGAGPEATPYLYHADGPFKGVKLNTGVQVGTGEHHEFDLPRVNGTALIGDPRNDENRFISQIQLAFLRAHNKFCDLLAGDGELHGSEIHEEARRLLTWHYQWGVVHGFLTSMCGAGAVRRVLAGGRRFYTPSSAFIPVEFSVAAYRFGHSMVPMSAQAQRGEPRQPLFGEVFGEGFTPLPSERAVVDMHEIFDTYDQRDVERAHKLDTKIASTLLNLGAPIVGTTEASLAIRNLDRGQAFLLPSGESVANAMGRSEAEVRNVSDQAKIDEPGLVNGTPLWYYILKEAEVVGRESVEGQFVPGEGLGPVGATIVAEVLIGLVELDDRSWLANNRSWRPTQVPVDGEMLPLDSIGDLLAWATA